VHEADPFDALGISPTLDRAAIKAAYVAAVRRSPPHVDEQAFRLVRAAYESLCDAAAVSRAWLQAPLDVERELARWNATFARRVEAACATQRAREDRAHSVERLIEHCTRIRIR
jgi:hypothetical protein